MHIPENYLSPITCGVMTAAMAPVWVHSVKKVAKELPKEKIALIGVGAAFSFVGMMFNVPLPGGTTGHATGGMLIAAVLGPEAACLAMSAALLLQALLFGDGGILSFGANCFNMAFVLPYFGYFIYQLILKLLAKKQEATSSQKVIASGIGAYAAINAAALCAAIEFGVQPYLFKDAAGQALYCPYGLDVAIPSMMIGHLTLFGIAEVVFTTAILAYILKTAPGAVKNETADDAGKKKGITAISILLAALIVLVPLGLLAEGTAWGEWGTDEIAKIETNGVALGYTPAGMENGFSMEALIPDYAINGLPDIAGYIVSAIIGVAVMVILFRLAGAAFNGKKQKA
ncbi:MAG: cobalt transporter CbiM [Lachnospiraceae bacterium]|nr:cobalt transporter CbiM [Lachnospiraceae bacterium]